jgi:mannitol/fructose-specific phosphotransferase system IIA component (Ntr-type)
MQLLSTAFREGTYLLDLEAHDVETVLEKTLDALAEQGRLAADDVPAVRDALLARERIVSTAIGHAIAVPHVYSDLIPEPIVAFVRLRHPINQGAPDGVPTRFLFILLGPPGATSEHLDTLTQIARLTSDDEFRYELSIARNGDELLASLLHFRQRAGEVTGEGIPTLEYHVDPLAPSGRLAGGLSADLRRRLPHYVDDLRQGLHSKTISATLFLFFACLAPAITFGGLMGDETEEAIGTVEMIAATAACGIAFALLGGTPLDVLGGTGPLLVLTALLYDLSGGLAEFVGRPGGQEFFLSLYAWVGLWTALLLILLAVTNASFLMRYVTRFTTETFAALISSIFVYKSIENLVYEFQVVENGRDRYHATALLSLLLAVGTFYVASNLSRFRNSRYLYSGMREFLSDFGPTIAIALMTAIAVWFNSYGRDWVDHVHLKMLPAPSTFATTSGRAWLVDLDVVPHWVKFAAVGPAMLVTLLIFVNQNITSRLVNDPDNKLHKGAAPHWDLLVVGVLAGACSLVGVPWLVASMVPSLNHVRALATVEEVVSGGTSRDRVIHTRETRLTGLLVHVLLGASLLALPLMQQIPMAVLYGLFLYMGVVSMFGNQFFERLALWPTDPDLYPRTHYVRRVPRLVIHAFTLMQLACLVVLWVVKDSPIGILFPLFIALLVPLRMLAGRWFDERHLAVLDADEEPGEEQTLYSQ